MKISDGEKLLMLMMSELYEALGIKGEIDPEFIKAAIFRDHLWALSWKYPGIPFEDHAVPEVVKEVLDILDMWTVIENCYAQLPPDQKDRLKEAVPEFKSEPRFQGFDGNNEAEHMSAALFLVNQLDRFTNFQERSLNSHSPSLEMHQRMLEEFLPIRRELLGDPLSFDQLVRLLKARVHPDLNRPGFPGGSIT